MRLSDPKLTNRKKVASHAHHRAAVMLASARVTLYNNTQQRDTLHIPLIPTSDVLQEWFTKWATCRYNID